MYYLPGTDSPSGGKAGEWACFLTSSGVTAPTRRLLIPTRSRRDRADRSSAQWNGPETQTRFHAIGVLAGLAEVGPVHLEGDMPHDRRGLMVRRRSHRPASLKKRQSRIAGEHHHRIIAPNFLMAALQAKDIAIPGDRPLDVA